MKDWYQKSIDFLLEHSCVNIRYLVHRDFLKTSVHESFMKEMRAEILEQSNVQRHFSAQHSDGWFGHELHGIDGMDGHIGDLLSLGVEAEHPRIQQAVKALLSPEIAGTHKNWFRGGDALDWDGRGGNRAIIAEILSWVKWPEDTPILSDEISLALEHLAVVKRYRSVEDFSIEGKSQRYYKPKAKFPGANHIDLLANTRGWRTAENIQTVNAAVKHGYEIMKDFDEPIAFRKPAEFGGGFVGPFNYNWQALKPIAEDELRNIIENPYPFQFGFWLRAVSRVPDWARQSTQTYELLADIIAKDILMDMIPVKTLKAFRQIMGKEPNWRKTAAAKCDVTFAVLQACWPVIAD